MYEGCVAACQSWPEGNRILGLNEYRTIFIVAGLAGILVLGWPVLGGFLPARATERFSELYVTGPEGLADDYPYNVTMGEQHVVILGVGNHLWSSSLYELRVKLRNIVEPLPNSTTGMPSGQASLYEERAFIADGQTVETSMDFSFTDIIFDQPGSCRVLTFTVNSVDVSLNQTLLWDAAKGGYRGELFFELWLYNPDTRAFAYHNRFVGFWLNIERT
jgi:hypothetical protein